MSGILIPPSSCVRNSVGLLGCAKVPCELLMAMSAETLGILDEPAPVADAAAVDDGDAVPAALGLANFAKFNSPEGSTFASKLKPSTTTFPSAMFLNPPSSVEAKGN